MACILIDYENEGAWLEGISLLSLTEKDEIIVFFSRNADHFPMKLHREFEKLSVKKRYIEAISGKTNALDFQLVSYLGYRISQNPFDKYLIVSMDRGFDCVCSFWRSRKVSVSRIDKISYYALANEIGI